MRILYCIPTLDYGGAERQLAYLASALAKSGHEVHVAFTRGDLHCARLQSGGARLHNVAGRGNYDPRMLFKLIRLIMVVKPDLVQTNLPQMDVAGGLAALLTRTPWILQETSAAPAYPRNWKHQLRSILAARAAAIVSNAQQGDAYWRDENRGTLRRVIPNPLPIDEIDAVHSSPSNRKLVLFAGRLDEGKNARTLIDALSRIASDVDFEAVFCGDGEQRRDLEQMTHTLGLASRVTFTGYVPNVWERMKAADVVVSLSRFEGCPNVVMEAMVCSCPLVLSDIAAHREMLDDDSALFVPSDDAARAAKAIKSALLFPDAAKARARAARQRAERWSVGTSARMYEEIYHALA